MAAAGVAATRARVLLGSARKAAAAAAASPASAGLCACCSGSALRANPFCTAAPQQQQQPSSAPPPDMKNYLWKRYNEAKKVTKGEAVGLAGFPREGSAPARAPGFPAEALHVSPPGRVSLCGGRFGASCFLGLEAEGAPSAPDRPFLIHSKMEYLDFICMESLKFCSSVYSTDLVPSIMSNLLNPDAIFSNNEMSLSDIEIYGFDYDYTLVFYSKHLHTLIFNAARDLLINEHRYPAEIRKYDYDPSFAIRGLHYDVHRALLMKIDAFHYIQLGTVYRGLSLVPDEEVIAMYDGSHVPLEQMSDFYGKSSQGNTMKQFMDIFSLPEMTLLSCVNEYFLKNNIDYEPVHLYKDVKVLNPPSLIAIHGAVALHGNETIFSHFWICVPTLFNLGFSLSFPLSNLEKYICYAEQTRAVLAKLADHGKKMFLITNSPSSFVDRGMKYIVGKDWRDLFDAVIVQADKPNFFNDKRRPFRKVNERGVLLWDKIHELQKGQIYKQGNLYEFLKLTGWRGSKVLYFGDHIYSDLADLTLKHGWRTGAIIPELRTEIKIMNTERYVQTMTWLQTLTGLLEHMQVHRDLDSQLIVHEWKKERKEMREMTRNFFNSQFGSLFRTDQNPTYFLRRLSRFADIYMASLSCLLNYDHDYTFYPRRTPLQHELPTWSDQLCTGTFRIPFLQEMIQIK
ncbi:hypothetical protein lerEdw1_019559 [Lerista edwardsae]|nr:hypothetical protein lerEdw1_019559 [Lerista edwardsae]